MQCWRQLITGMQCFWQLIDCMQSSWQLIAGMQCLWQLLTTYHMHAVLLSLSSLPRLSSSQELRSACLSINRCKKVIVRLKKASEEWLSSFAVIFFSCACLQSIYLGSEAYCWYHDEISNFGEGGGPQGWGFSCHRHYPALRAPPPPGPWGRDHYSLCPGQKG